MTAFSTPSSGRKASRKPLRGARPSRSAAARPAMRLSITGVAESGAGIAEAVFKGRSVRVFVPGGLPGDEVEARLLPAKAGSQSLTARIESIPVLSPERRAEPGCPMHEQCGGCPLSPLRYPAQLELKQRMLAELFRAAPELAPQLRPALPATPSSEAPRNKAVLHFAGRPGALALGLYAQGTHRVAGATLRCPRCPAWMEQAARALLEAANRLGLEPWDEAEGRGLLRSVLMRGGRDGERLLCLVTSAAPSEGVLEQLAAAVKAVPVTTAVLNVNAGRTNAILGEKSRTLFGRGFITASISGLRFRVRPETFLQINPVMTPKLYELALDLAQLRPGDTALDLYCGVGSLTLLAARRAASVAGVEISAASIEEAKRNAQENGVSNAAFFCGAAEAVLPQLAAQGIRPRVVIADPPRKGLEASVPAQIAALGPETIIYIACGPKALVRDCLAFARLGYRLEAVQPVDLFPETLHIETVCALSKLDVHQKITADLKMDELDVTAAETKATYEEIRSYVKEHTGLNVSHLYIAQVKQKCGIKERENYNKPQSENSRQPKCPPEKEKAIQKALKHFKII